VCFEQHTYKFDFSWKLSFAWSFYVNDLKLFTITVCIILQFNISDQIHLSLHQIYRSVAFGKPKEESPDNVEYHTV